LVPTGGGTFLASETAEAVMKPQVENLLYEALETEIGGVQIYTDAVKCARNEDLKEEWEEYLEQTKKHEEILRNVFEELGLDAEKETPGRLIVRHQGESLVEAIEMARGGPDPEAAQIVAAECVVLAETKDHQNWELIGELSKKLEGKWKKALSAAHEEVEDEEDEHLYHTQGWARELWIAALGLPAALPPPEEEKDVKTAIGAARAKQSRKQFVRGRKSRPEPRA
jgi:hypothetical protein